GAPWTNQWGWQSDEIDKLIDAAAFEVDPEKRRELYARFQQRANQELPLWMAIERLLISVSTSTLQNQRNTPRWVSSSWHDLWVAA
ncbi:MAG TPA: ABC transporter substrate-binding protein, partial [Burkholderiaceae bacterium]|nr:ABC transporter substrate-binding protein [Burkholderiaceae bacterium]